MVLHGAVRTSARALLRLLSDREFRRVSALSTRFALSRRHRAGSVRIDGRPFRFPDAASFLSAYEEIFADRIYAFEARRARPLILDLGANVGLSVLYFKRSHPDARIVAIEPDPEIFRYLETNVTTHGLEDVTLRNAAVWTETTTLAFVPDGADGGRLEGAGTVHVPAVALAELMGDDTIDFLKMDIEGAENDIIPACAGLLGRVDNIFVEYHSVADQPQRLSAILSTLAGAGFRLSLQTVKSRRSAFLAQAPDGHFDLQINISGFRR